MNKTLFPIFGDAGPASLVKVSRKLSLGIGLAVGLGLTSLSPAKALTEAEIIRGFNLTVFGAEYAPLGIQSRYIRKFNSPVRFYVHNLSKIDRRRRVQNFILSLNRSVRGLKTRIASRPSQANFNVYVVDRKDYVKVVRERVYKRSSAVVPGKCLVRAVFSPAGIIRSDAVIVSDGGEALFKRCMIEEVLQGLGPLNEHRSLAKSMFNDSSKHTSFTNFDRHIMNVLYDPRIRNGTVAPLVARILPGVVRDVKKRLR